MALVAIRSQWPSVALQARSWMVLEKPKLPGNGRFRSNNRDRRFESILLRHSVRQFSDISENRPKSPDTEVLYDRPISFLRYFDAQAGIRYDLDSNPGRTWGAIGLEGLAPYFFEFEPTLYFRHSVGDRPYEPSASTTSSFRR
jgi:hypothetical protein